MDTSPLGMQFQEFDADHDGLINATEAHDLLKLLGKNIYMGSVQNIIRLMNLQTQDPTHLTFEQFQQYFESFESVPKHDIWKAKLELLAFIKDIRLPLIKNEENANTAAPGSSAPGSADKQLEPTEGNIEITVGPTNQNYDCLVEFNLTKEKKAESKPYVKIVFEQNSVERAKELENIIKALHDNIVNLVKEMQPEYTPIAESFNVLTNVIDSRLNVFITTSSQELIDLGLTVSQFFDKILNDHSEGKLSFKHRFSVDIEKFMDPNSDYTFYHTITQNTHTSIQWRTLFMKEVLREILKLNDVFSELKYDKTEIMNILTIGLLHLDRLDGSFAFDNAEFGYAEQESKQQILECLSQFQNEISEFDSEKKMSLNSLLKSIDNKILVEVSLGDWKSQLRVEIKNLNQLLLKSLKPSEQGSAELGDDQ